MKLTVHTRSCLHKPVLKSKLGGFAASLRGITVSNCFKQHSAKIVWKWSHRWCKKSTKIVRKWSHEWCKTPFSCSTASLVFLDFQDFLGSVTLCLCWPSQFSKPGLQIKLQSQGKDQGNQRKLRAQIKSLKHQLRAMGIIRNSGDGVGGCNFEVISKVMRMMRSSPFIIL